ncbi:MAG: hypothetical protein KY475_13365 [Planctomycetes bacterium]|nr:hypothetical protein [Planctomycetota bacterium]
MDFCKLSAEHQKTIQKLLGYLNFSSGATDPQFLGELNSVYSWVETSPTKDEEPAAPWRRTLALLRSSLEELCGSSDAFRDCSQAAAVLDLVESRVVPGYFEFHRDLLFHQRPDDLLLPFFLGRIFEAVLAQGAPWSEEERITTGAVRSLNDYLGHRPVPVLESQRHEPYPREWVRPVPLYIRGAGVSVGPHEQVVRQALELLQSTDEDLLEDAYFDPKLLDELAFDPRAYDFDHPVNKRPNYHFGQWDPHLIDNRGKYRRFVVQQVTLDALMDRIDQPSDLPHQERLFEAAAVLAGTILMASGISGSGPDSHDSETTLGTLLPEIAANRDAFYERLFAKVNGAHAQRLKKEAAELRQPFGGARQHLNAQLARRRAAQLEHIHLAKLYARMGYFDAAEREANIAPTASARMLCQIDCRLTAGHKSLEKGDLDSAFRLLPEIMELLHRAIQCGAVIDPWSILGFDANFSLFPALENSIHDHRADELVLLMEDIFALASRVWSEAAAVDNQPLCRSVATQYREMAEWWRQFAAHEVSSVEAVDAQNLYRAAEHVADVLNLWHKGGAEAGNVAFWAPHAERFDSPQAYSLVIDAVLDKGDFVAAMALLVHWLSHAETIGLEKADCSFHGLAERWLRESAEWPLTRKFLDYLEANGEAFWEVPAFELSPEPADADEPSDFPLPMEDDEDDDEGLFSAAYEEMVYIDSTADGQEGDVFDEGEATDDELEQESRRIAERLAFHVGLARMWGLAALLAVRPDEMKEAGADEKKRRLESLTRWVSQAEKNRRDLLALLEVIDHFALASPAGDHDSMVEYDRQRVIKETLLERVMAAVTETVDAGRHLLAASCALGADASSLSESPGWDLDQRRAIAVFGGILRGEPKAARKHWSELLRSLEPRALLYIPLSKGGNPCQIVAARVRQRMIQDLLAWLPRLGLLTETRRLIETAREMERNNPVGPGAVTEFDELFRIGYRSLVECLVTAASAWGAPKSAAAASDAALVDCLEDLTRSLLESWMAHSQTLRLSVLEKVQDDREWDKLVSFIKKYGGDLFTQRFLNLGNIRAILHQGAEAWLAQIAEDPLWEGELKLLHDLGTKISRRQAAEQLNKVLEAVIENYGEYRDYNSTTTQSDRGEMLYTLLDFLRLRTAYDRVAWNLKPVVLAHDILVRRGRLEAAHRWREALTREIQGKTHQYLAALAQLQKKYAMRMPTVADRINERFTRPMVIDRICALVEPALRDANESKPSAAFEQLEADVSELTREPSGVGLDTPPWLASLEEEVDDALDRVYNRDRQIHVDALIPQVPLTFEKLRRELNKWLADE